MALEAAKRRDVLEEISQQSGVRFVFAGHHEEVLLTDAFTDLPLEEGLRRLLQGASGAWVHSAEDPSRLDVVVVLPVGLAGPDDGDDDDDDGYADGDGNGDVAGHLDPTEQEVLARTIDDALREALGDSFARDEFEAALADALGDIDLGDIPLPDELLSGIPDEVFDKMPAEIIELLEDLENDPELLRLHSEFP